MTDVKDEEKVEAKVAPRRPASKAKATRPAGGWNLLKRMKELGTGAHKLQVLYDKFPKDKYGKMTADVPAKQVVQWMVDMVEEDEAAQEAGQLLVPRFDEITVDKAKSVLRTGTWEPPIRYEPDLEDALPDEEFDPEAEDEFEEEEPVKKPKKKAKK
jgi:hypothetical protein